MELLNQIVIHKLWGEGFVSRHDASGFFVTFGGEEKPFSYPDSFAAFLRFADPQLQKDAEDLLAKKAEEKSKAMASWHSSSYVQTVNRTSVGRAPKKVEKPNIAFKCNFCDGGSNKYHIGYMGACSDKQIQYNIQVANHSWCSDPDCPCCQYLNGEIDGNQLDDMCRDGGFVCYESQMLREWTAFAGFVLKGDRKEEPKKLRNVQLNSLAVLTTRKPGMSEEDRFIFGVFMVDDADEGNSLNEGFVRSNSKYRIELSPAEALQIKFWNYHANDNNPSKCTWSQGLHRYINDIEAVQILRDIVAVKRLPVEKKFAEEFLAHFCRMKKINLAEVPKPNGALKR